MQFKGEKYNKLLTAYTQVVAEQFMILNTEQQLIYYHQVIKFIRDYNDQ